MRGVGVAKKDPGNVVRLKVLAPKAAGLPAPASARAPEHERHADDIHPLLEQQLIEAADTDGKLRLRKLLAIITSQYDAFEIDRTSFETVMRLASDETTAITEKLERESVTRLQAILDHVKDGIISCDHLGRIESVNRTAERFFGVRECDVLSDSLDSLLPDIVAGGDIGQTLDDLASTQENTHYDLAAREVVAKHRRGTASSCERKSSKNNGFNTFKMLGTLV